MDNQNFSTTPINQSNQAPYSQSPINNSNPKTLVKILSSLLIVVVIAGVGLGVYVWQHNKVTSLQTKLNATNTANVANSNKTTVTSSASASTTTNSTEYFYLYQYGIKFPISKNIDDLYYSGITQQASTGVVGGDILDFSTESLSSAEPACSAYDTLPASSAGLEQGASPFGYILVTSSPIPSNQVGSQDEDAGTLLAQANGYYLYYKHPQDTCVGEDSQQDVNPADQTLLQNQTNSFVSAIKQAQAIN